ncbi:MAG: MtrB/PioB family outer membrane beta-barrel protein, partial [Sterolibacterium sp.]
MKPANQNFTFSRTLLALSLLAAFAPAQAEDDPDLLPRLSKPESSFSIGAAGVSGDKSDRAIFGQYNGMRKDGGYLILDLDYIKRDETTGTWTILQGRNLGLDNRELSATYWKQGD